MRLNKKRMAAQCQSWIPGPVPDKDGMEGGRRPHSTQRNNQKTGILCSNDHALSFLVSFRENIQCLKTDIKYGGIKHPQPCAVF